MIKILPAYAMLHMDIVKRDQIPEKYFDTAHIIHMDNVHLRGDELVCMQK